MRKKILLALLGLGLVMGPALPVMPYWEISQLSTATRLPENDPGLWETALVFSEEIMFPGEITCPPGYKVIVHFLNNSPFSVNVAGKLENRPNQTVPAGGLATLVLGKLDAGVHVYHVQYKLMFHCHNETEDISLPFRVKAGIWPGETDNLREACIFYNGRPYPRRTRIPSGVHTDLGLANAGRSRTLSLKAGDWNFMLPANQLTVVEMRKPRKASHIFPLAEDLGSWHLDIR